MTATVVVQGLVHLVGLIVVVTLVLSIRRLITRRVTTARRPLTVYRLGIQLTMLAIYLNYLVQRVWNVSGLPRGLTAIGTVLVFVLIAFDWLVTDRVDGNEYEQLLRHEAERAVGDG
jgi:hypothetical protein